MKRYAPFVMAFVAVLIAYGSYRQTHPKPAASSARWHDSLSAALAEARRTGKPVFVDLYATWCMPCKILDRSYDRQPLANELKKWVVVKIDVDRQQAIAQRFNVDKLPTMVFLAPNGKELGRKFGFKTKPDIDNDDELFDMVAAQLTETMQGYSAKLAARPT